MLNFVRSNTLSIITLFFYLLVLCFLVRPIAVFAGGVPHSVVGRVFNSDESQPGQSDMQISAYITYISAGGTNSTTLTLDSPAISWGSDTVFGTVPWFEIECSSFSGVWAVNDVLHITFNNTANGESSSINVVLKTDEPQVVDDTSLPVELSSFSAICEQEGIKLEWTTESEVSNLGFNLLKSTSKEGSYKKINDRLIEGAGTNQSRSQYVFIDSDVKVETIYFYKLQSLSLEGTIEDLGSIQIEYTNANIPDHFYLTQNYPNPFNPTTTIEFGLPENNHVTISIYNLTGQWVKTLADTDFDAGVHKLQWDGTSNSGIKLGTGIYFYKIQTRNFSNIKQLLFIK